MWQQEHILNMPIKIIEMLKFYLWRHFVLRQLVISIQLVSTVSIIIMLANMWEIMIKAGLDIPSQPVVFWKIPQY